MPRVKGGTSTHKRHSRILQRAKGYYGARSRLIRTASDAVDTAAKYSTRDRRQRKRDFRRLWITRVSAAIKALGGNYSRLMNDCSKAKVEINRKMLSEIAIQDPAGFEAIVNTVRK